MNLLVAYAIGGLLAYLWLCARSKESAESALGFLFSDPSALLIGSVFWPVVIPFLVIEGKIQAKEKNEKENRIEYATDDLGVLEGKFGDTVTPQNPSGRVLVRGIFKGQAKIKSQFVTYAPEYQSSWLSS